ncbi:MAG: putative lipid II flippase FtsW [Chloroflexi bacterium]|nr:MAG: putative lipid II flippase FtsW [Chloroflexota bacterium]TME02543.1 MAG: putative lipid II flippase FtsW [Chloroflexota bacterium]TME37814.1 MAG: putative lipid II flippase FtsW [Chloroflexota bacterium]TME51972.1 MAG: putative lipid II flippase FtsW [Chloroflexota bacterium]
MSSRGAGSASWTGSARSSRTVERPQPDRLLLFTTVLLCAAGLVMVTSASVAFAYTQHQSAFYYAERQAAWMLIGFVALFILGRIDYRKVRPLAPAGAVAVILLMLLVLLPQLGVSVNGARRWFDAGPLGTFQPSELGKLAFAVFIAHWIDRNSQRMGDFQHVFVPFVAMLAGVLVLLMLERDLGTAVVMVGIFVSAYWAGGGRLRHIILLMGALALGFVAVTLLEPYRIGRLTAFKNPWADPLGAGFQATQSIYGLASGGIFGVGIGHSIEKYGWLPEAHTDFIFAIVGEETGLIGATLVMLGFLVFGVRGYRASLRAPDRFGMALAASITTWITFEALLNMATVTNTLPITGVPLPFFSYGGTALATTLAAVGVVLSIARHGSGTALGNNRGSDEAFDRGRRDRRAPVSGARSRASVSR